MQNDITEIRRLCRCYRTGVDRAAEAENPVRRELCSRSLQVQSACKCASFRQQSCAYLDGTWEVSRTDLSSGAAEKFVETAVELLDSVK